ncbi:acetolactate synthase large subunit [Botrimarina hoheduenensis]|uniref:Acetolactate synthase, catabolic n=1 Tax=Botrimarina hoheduenensis TaxID=2528000 RepID=A0A5C5VVH5_9BACT|nr:acetolactate synthase large subunit [Botrimarina hoheduenensis]TWT41532.1 Acetolactate synthase, catabolic [Botrimarina hoheduenensis]
MKASDLFVRALEAEGVEYLFGIPGEENLDLLDSLSRSNIRLVLTRHEQAAGFMAATYGRLTGKAGVCLSTLGPGATNFVTAAAYAQLGAMPMLMITGQKPIKSSKQGHFQIIDTVDMMRPLTKYTKQIVSGDNIPSRVREAFRVAEEERPGAVHLELPEDIAKEKTDAPVMPRSKVRRPSADEKSIQHAIELTETAKRPLLLIGAGANRRLSSRMLQRFVHQTGIPFFTTQMGKGVIDDDSELCLGTAALSAGDFLHRAIDAADLIINVGHDVVEKPPFFMTPGGVKVIHVNFTSAEVDPVYFPHVEVVGDIANSVWRLGNEIRPQSTWDFSRFFEVKQALEANQAEHAADDRFPLTPARLVSEVQTITPSDGVLSLDNGMYKIWFARNYKAHEPNTLLLDNALATMGAGLPAAIAAQIVHPERFVMAICGDGGFLMNEQDLETAVRLKLNLNVLILNDSGYGMIKWKQTAEGYTDYGLDFTNPDFVKLAEAYGARGHRIESAEDLLPTLERCRDTPGVDIIDCPVDYSVNIELLNQQITELAAAL